jgi:7,8-dihydroneopterin aldolase/epimerase/oxygenase
MTDGIFITGLLIHAHHGVMRHEKKVGQQFVIDLELAIDLAQAAATDKLVDTVSYSSIVEAVTRAFTAKTYRLVEAAAGAIADEVLASFPRIASVRVTVHKPHAPIAAIFSDVGVTISRNRRT